MDNLEDGSAAIARVEYDRQVATARMYPRSLDAFRKETIKNVTLSTEVARSCIYALPRQDRESGRTKVIEGPSARFAEIILSAWGNCAAGSRIVREDADYVYAQGAFVDLERNTRTWQETSRRITTREGGRYSADMVMQTANAAGSIARRNAILAGIPKAFWSEAYGQARRVVAGDAETFAKRREVAVDTAKKMGLSVERVYHALGVAGLADIGIDEYVTLEGLLSAVREGEANIDAAFPEPGGGPAVDRPPGRGMSGLRERVRKDKARSRAEGAKQEAPAGTPAAAGTSPAAPPGPTTQPTPVGAQATLPGVQPMCRKCTRESDPRFTFAGEHYCAECNPNRKAPAP